MNEKINKAYSILGVIKRHFIYIDKNTFILFTTYQGRIGDR